MLANDYQENYLSGWVKLFRSFSQWEWYKDSKMVHLFLHLLIKANHKDKHWQGQLIKRGQLATGRKELSQQTGISEQSIRTCINRLKSTNEITIKTTTKNSIITIINYDFYQLQESTNQQTNQRSTYDQPTTNHKQEVKNYKKYIHPQKFYNSELEKCKDKEIYQTYERFVKFLFGDNPTGEKLSKVLGMKHQIKVDKFEEFLEAAKLNGKKITETVLRIENNKNGYKSFALTLNNWIKNEIH